MYSRTFAVFTSLCLLAVLFAGCAVLGEPKEGICTAAPENSVLCGIVPNPEDADLLIRLSSLAAIDAELVTPEQILDFTARLRTYIEQGWTWAALADFVDDRAGAYIVIASDYIEHFKELNAVITDWDAKYLLIHLDRVDAVAKMRL